MKREKEDMKRKTGKGRRKAGKGRGKTGKGGRQEGEGRHSTSYYDGMKNMGGGPVCGQVIQLTVLIHNPPPVYRTAKKHVHLSPIPVR